MKNFKTLFFLVITSVILVVSVARAEEKELLYTRMDSGDLSFEAISRELKNGDIEKAEAIARERASEDLYILGKLQELQLECNKAKNTYRKVIELNPGNREAAKDLKGTILCPRR